MKKEIFIDYANGNDFNDGIREKTYKTLRSDIIRSGAVVNLLGGVYYLSETVCIRNLKDILFKSEEGAIYAQ